MPHRLAFLLALLVYPVAAHAEAPPSVQEALLRAKPATVMVVTEVAADVTLRCAGVEMRARPEPVRETGTAWVVAPGGWVVTNAHVVAAAHAPPVSLARHLAETALRTECLPRLLARRSSRRATADVEDVFRRALVEVMPSARVSLAPDVAVVLGNGRRLTATVEKYAASVDHGASATDLALLHVPADDLPSLALADRRVQIGDHVHVIGFPSVLLSHELLAASAHVEASVTTGAVSGLNQDRDGRPVLQIDAAAAPGTSGAPVVDGTGAVIGVLTMPGDDDSVQGFNFVIPAAAVRGFLQGTPARPAAPGRFDAAWRAALRHFFTGDYRRAEQRLAEAERLVPDLPDVARLAAEARARERSQPLLPWDRIAAAVLVVVGLVWAWMAARHWRRTRYRIGAAEVARRLESADPPVVLDVRDDLTYAQSPVRIPRSVHVRPADLESTTPTVDVDRGRPVVAYCSSPDELTSARVAHLLRRLGFRDVRVLRGGLGAWANAGLPLEPKT